MLPTKLLAVAIAATSLVAGVAHADAVVATNPATIVKVLQDEGYKAELTKDESGDPLIRSSSSGTSFAIFFYGCTKGKDCKTVQFFAGFTDRKPSLERINEWNSKKRFGRAYISDKGAARVEMDVDLEVGGMSSALFADNLEYWVATLSAFEKHIAE